MRTLVLQEILDGVDCLDADDQAKHQFRNLVRTIGATHGIRGISHSERIDFAQRLLAANISRPTIRDRLMARYDVSKSHAYRIIDAAMNCPKTEQEMGQNAG